MSIRTYRKPKHHLCAVQENAPESIGGTIVMGSRRWLAFVCAGALAILVNCERGEPKTSPNLPKGLENVNATTAGRTPVETWQVLLDAMVGRKFEDMEPYMTPKGRSCLYGKIPLGRDPEDVIAKRAAGWKEWPLRWFQNSGKKVAEAYMGPPNKRHKLSFKNTKEGWKLDEWIAGK